MLSQIVILVVETAFGLLLFVLLLRFFMQLTRAPFRNPIGEFVQTLSNWAVLPARRVVPGLFGIDLATVLLAWVVEVVKLAIVLSLRGYALGEAGAPALLLIAALAVVELLRFSLYLLIGAVLVQVVTSWVAPYTPLTPVFDALTRPFYRVFRRYVPPIGNIDLSPLFVVLLAQIAQIPLEHLVRWLATPL
ncbi:MAG: YggT family protein [Betaproteobacteria bacterium]|nr:YggT family protein [Betaproteobacteria bacterium]